MASDQYRGSWQLNLTNCTKVSACAAAWNAAYFLCYTGPTGRRLRQSEISTNLGCDGKDLESLLLCTFPYGGPLMIPPSILLKLEIQDELINPQPNIQRHL